MQYETIEVKADGPIDWLSLNRPQNLNAITPRMCDELQDYFLKLQSKQTKPDDKARSLVIIRPVIIISAAIELPTARGRK